MLSYVQYKATDYERSALHKSTTFSRCLALGDLPPLQVIGLSMGHLLLTFHSYFDRELSPYYGRLRMVWWCRNDIQTDRIRVTGVTEVPFPQHRILRYNH